jgi:lipoprotein signal peptidase
MTSQETAGEWTRQQQWRRLAICLLVVAVLVALDLWSKQAVWSWLDPIEYDLERDAHGHHRYHVLGGSLTFMLNLNYGAAWGQGENFPYLLVGGRIAAACLLLWLIWRTLPGQRMYLCALTMILAGALGNLYDNLFKPIEPALGRVFGPVRDFIDVYFGIWDWHFPTFNVADSCISVGAALLLISGFGNQPEPEPEPEPGTDSAS